MAAIQSDFAKEAIEFKPPSGVSILIPISDVESIYAILNQTGCLNQMLRTTPSIPIYLDSKTIDMHNSFNGLFGIIKGDLNHDAPRNG